MVKLKGVRSSKLQVVNTDPFLRDLKKYSKKHPSLEEDIATMLDAAFNNFIVKRMALQLDGFKCFHQEIDNGIELWKVRELACKNMKRKGKKSGYRVVIHLCRETNILELVELYHKSDKVNEDRKRIFELYGIKY